MIQTASKPFITEEILQLNINDLFKKGYIKKNMRIEDSLYHINYETAFEVGSSCTEKEKWVEVFYYVND
jgi:hypothetical protein